MGLWYLSAVMFLAFTGLFWAYSDDRLNPTETYANSIAGLASNCQKAGLREISLDHTFGAQAISTARYCQYKIKAADSANAYLHYTDVGQNIVVPGFQMIAYRPSQIGDATSYLAKTRSLVLFVPPTVGNINGASFNEVARQLRKRWPDPTEAGLVEADVATNNKLHMDTGGILVTRVPTSVPVGSFAIVHSTNDNGWPATGCTTGPSGNTCSKVVAAPATLTDASNACLSDGGFLAKLTSATDLSDLRSIPGGSTPDLWIDGAINRSGTPTHYYYSGSTIDMQYGGTSTLLWASGQPDNSGGNEQCIILQSDGKWNDKSCTETHPYACMY